MCSARAPIGRLDHVDGLRTIAIFWVAVYHFAYFWTPAGPGDNLTPYADALAWIPLSHVGYLGVYLFFIVSGFVISLSLTRSPSMARFTTLRAIRLWPTLLICGTLTFVVTSAFGPPALMRTPLEYLISLTFIPPPYVGRIIGAPGMAWLDGAYWSLWTEIRFYAVAALLYYAIRGKFLLLWTIFATACAAVHLAGLQQGGAFSGVSRILFAEYQPFFTAGIALATLRISPNNVFAQTLLTVAVLQAVGYAWVAHNGAVADLFGLVIVFTLAIPTMLAKNTVPILSSRPLVVLGGASYAYYLVHQNIGLSLLNYISPEGTGAQIATMIAIQIGLVLVSVILTAKLEAPLRTLLRNRATKAAA